MNRFGNFLLSALFIIFIFIFGIFMVLTPDIELSEVENRTMAQKPEWNMNHIKDGSYMEEFESYITDQFPYRDKWLKTYVDFQRMTNQTYIYDYYIADDNWMLAKPDYGFDKAEMTAAAGKINDLGAFLEEKNIDLYYFSVPHKVTLMQFLLPDYIKKGIYLEDIHFFMNELDDEKVTYVDMTTDFDDRFSEEEIKNMYFKTDHHWTMQGAFEGYKAIAETLTDTSVKESDYNEKCLDSSRRFEGSYNKQVYMSVDADDEKMCIFTPKNGDFFNYEVTLNGDPIDSDKLYGKAFNNNNNPVNYSQLFSGNYREIDIINNKNTDKNNNILIVKDSYANAMIYHIAEHFYHTTVYDIRYNEDRTLLDYIEENDFDTVAIVYNSATLFGEMYNFDTLSTE